MKKKILIVAILISLCLPFSAIYAFDVKTDNSIKLAKDEVADGNIYASCSDMTIDGTVNGDVIALCKNIIINGLVNGDVIAFGEKIEINGSVKGNVRVAGSKININGSVDRNVNIFGSEIIFNKDSLIKWDVLVAGVNGNFEGNVDGNLHGLMSFVKISGKIGKNVNLSIDDRNSQNQAGNFLITKDAVIAGSVSYTASKDIRLESSSSVAGKVEKNNQPNKEKNPMATLWNIFYKAASLILIAILIISLKKNLIKETNQTNDHKWMSNILSGLAILILTPLVIALLVITVIGIPLAFIILTSYLSLVILSMIFASYYLMELLIKKISKKEANAYLSAILGLIIFSILSVIPFIGWLCVLIITSLGLGSLFKKITTKENA